MLVRSHGARAISAQRHALRGEHLALQGDVIEAKLARDVVQVELAGER
ncbi:hypothetical protein [Sphingomonas sp.]|jgi:hypothetical protein